MSQSLAEISILTINALGAGIWMLVSGVVQKLMNDMDEPEFKRFVNRLDRAAMGDPFGPSVATFPLLSLSHTSSRTASPAGWFIAGVGVWVIGSAVTKVVNMPIYQRVAQPSNTDPEALREKRRTLQFGNRVRAWTTLGSVVLIACQFGAIEVALTIVVGVVVSVMFMWL